MNSPALVLGALWLTSTLSFGASCKNQDGKTIPIRVAQKAEYSRMEVWPNPSVHVSDEGFAVMVRPSKVWGPSLTFDDTLITLDQQSCDAWPLGAVIVLSEGGGLSPTYDDADAANRMRRLKDALERKGIVVILVPGD